MPVSSNPPDTLTKDELSAVANVRRDIWSSAFYGMGVGGLAGYASHTLLKLGNRYNLWQIKLSRNTLLASTMVGLCLGSFCMSSMTGQNEVHKLHPIFRVGARDTQTNESYESAIERARNREEALHTLAQRQSVLGHLNKRDAQIMADEEDRLLRERNRLYRRATLSQQVFDPGHGGLSDSHGGHWVDDQK